MKFISVDAIVINLDTVNTIKNIDEDKTEITLNNKVLIFDKRQMVLFDYEYKRVRELDYFLSQKI